MTTIENFQTNASHHAAAIARWDDEGGAAMSFADKTDAQVSEDGGCLTGVPASQTIDRAVAEERQILGCLGAAVIMRWGTLPTKIQRELFEHATSLADRSQRAQLKGQLARFLHNHNNGGDPTTGTMRRQGMA